MPQHNEPFDAPFVVWINGYTDGWAPYGFDTIEECYTQVIDYSAHSFVITEPPIKVAFTKVHQA